MSIKVLNNFTKIESKLHAIPGNNTEAKLITPVKNEINTFPDIMNKAIDDFLQAGELNIAAKVKFHKILDAALPSIMSRKNFINKGRDSKVYRISDKYVAKIRRGKDEQNAIKIFNFAKIPDKRFSTLEIYYGEPVARVGNVEILKNATPKDYRSCGIVWINSNNKYGHLAQDVESYNKEYIPFCSSLPQESYDELAKGLNELNSISDKNIFSKTTFYTPDIKNPNNVLISDNHFRIVDELDKIKERKPNTIYTMLQPIMLRLTPDAPVHREESLITDRRNILRKTMIAAEKAELPLNVNSAIDPYAGYYLDDITGQCSTKMIDLLSDMRKNMFSQKERVDFINKAFMKK